MDILKNDKWLEISYQILNNGEGVDIRQFKRNYKTGEIEFIGTTIISKNNLKYLLALMELEELKRCRKHDLNKEVEK